MIRTTRYRHYSNPTSLLSLLTINRMTAENPTKRQRSASKVEGRRGSYEECPTPLSCHSYALYALSCLQKLSFIHGKTRAGCRFCQVCWV